MLPIGAARGDEPVARLVAMDEREQRLVARPTLSEGPRQKPERDGADEPVAREVA